MIHWIQLVLGQTHRDSIVEASDLPSPICGHAVVNAEIGGTTIGYFVRNAALLLREVKPSQVVLAVGINGQTHPKNFS
jgi:hypothetical protein